MTKICMYRIGRKVRKSYLSEFLRFLSVPETNQPSPLPPKSWSWRRCTAMYVLKIIRVTPLATSTEQPN